jgi:hypothetical protein
MAEYLYDQPRNYFLHGCVTDGRFDAEKATALGYSPAQFDAIEEFLGLEDARVDTAPLVEPEEETGG